MWHFNRRFMGKIVIFRYKMAIFIFSRKKSYSDLKSRPNLIQPNRNFISGHVTDSLDLWNHFYKFNFGIIIRCSKIFQKFKFFRKIEMNVDLEKLEFNTMENKSIFKNNGIWINKLGTNRNRCLFC